MDAELIFNSPIDRLSAAIQLLFPLGMFSLMTELPQPVSNDPEPLALIMKGGGILGLAYVGALEVLSKHHKFNWFVGTSAGAISAVLLAAGFTTDEMFNELERKNFADFFDTKWFVAKIFNLCVYGGFHRGNAFTHWLDSLLAKKLESPGRVTLKQIDAATGNRVTVYACSSRRPAIVFDSPTSNDDAAYAARCSMSIPFVFVPQGDQGFGAYDGGLRFNFPVEETLKDKPDLPFLALYLGPEIYEPPPERPFPFRVFFDLVTIGRGSFDADVLEKYKTNTIIIDPRPIDWLDFDLTYDEKQFLLECGRAAAYKHLSRESDEYKASAARRDQLRQTVETARATKVQARKDKTKRRRRLIFWCFVLSIIAIGSYLLVAQLLHPRKKLTFTPEELVTQLDIDEKNQSLKKWIDPKTQPVVVIVTTLAGSESRREPAPHILTEVKIKANCLDPSNANWSHTFDYILRDGYELPALNDSASVNLQGKIESAWRMKRYCPGSPSDPKNPAGYTWQITLTDCVIVE